MDVVAGAQGEYTLRLLNGVLAREPQRAYEVGAHVLQPVAGALNPRGADLVDEAQSDALRGADASVRDCLERHRDRPLERLGAFVDDRLYAQCGRPRR